MKIGEVRVADDADFSTLKSMCTVHDGWTLAYNKKAVHVWTKKNDVSSFKMVKVRCQYTDISAAVLYDVLHDPEYRKVWDSHMLSGEDICYINPNNDIGYYAARSPPPLRNRDFVMQRSWLENNGEYMIMNHSINYADRPSSKKFIRGISYMTGYYIISKGPESCDLYYITQSDLRGRIPSWVINRASHRVAPTVVAKLHKAGKQYPGWKAKPENRPSWKPWYNPEQITLPRIDWDKVQPMDEVLQSEIIDESNVEDKGGEGSDVDSVNSDKVSLNGES